MNIQNVSTKFFLKFTFMYVYNPEVKFLILNLQTQACAVFHKQVCLILRWAMAWMQSELILLSHTLDRVYLKDIQAEGKRLRFISKFG